MANRIKGITVEIGGDTTKLQTALKGVKPVALIQLLRVLNHIVNMPDARICIARV